MVDCSVSVLGEGYCLHGTCSGSVCMCEDGWELQREMCFVDVQPCFFSESLDRILYQVATWLNVAALSFQIYVTKSRRQAKRTVPMFIAYMLMLTALIERTTADPGTVRFGENFVFTFAAMNSIGFFFGGTTVFLAKYVQYLDKLAGFGIVNESNALALNEKLISSPIPTGLYLLGINASFTIACFVPNVRKEGCFFAGFIWLIGGLLFALGVCVLTMKAAKCALSKTLVLNASSIVRSETSKTLASRLRKQINTCERIKRSTIVCNSCMIILFGYCIFSVDGFYAWIYIFPFISCTWACFMLLSTISAWRAGARRRRRICASSPMASQTLLQTRKNCSSFR